MPTECITVVTVLRQIQTLSGANMTKLEVSGPFALITVWFNEKVYSYSIEDDEWHTPQLLIQEIVDYVTEQKASDAN